MVSSYYFSIGPPSSSSDDVSYSGRPSILIYGTNTGFLGRSMGPEFKGSNESSEWNE